MGGVDCMERFGRSRHDGWQECVVSHTKTDRLACVVFSAMLFFLHFGRFPREGRKGAKKSFFVTTLSCK
jgi:hypothetical protein